MKKKYIKPCTRAIEIEITGAILVGSDGEPSLQNIELDDEEEAEVQYGIW